MSFIRMIALSAFMVFSPIAAHAAPPVKFALQVDLTGNGTVTSSPGGITCPTSCLAYFKQAANITLTSTPAAGETFIGWGGACSGTGTCSVPSIQGDVQVSAQFSSNGGGGGPTNEDLDLRLSDVEQSLDGLEDWLARLTIAADARVGADGNGNFWAGKLAFNQSLLTGQVGGGNIAIGESALATQTNNGGNIAIGYQALQSNTTGHANVAIGGSAPLGRNSQGRYNTAVGNAALASDPNFSANSAFGHQAMAFFSGTNNVGIGTDTLAGFYGADNYGDRNTAIGQGALARFISGHDNIAVGRHAGFNLFRGSSNIIIGNEGGNSDGMNYDGQIIIGDNTSHNAFFAGGIFGSTISGAGATVVADSDGKIGTVVSTREAKRNIENLGEASEAIYSLRPVTFFYKENPSGREAIRQYGLIAEEVAEFFPELTVFDHQGKPTTVAYHLIVPLLLNEMQRLHAQINSQATELEQMKAMFARLLDEEIAIELAGLRKSQVSETGFSIDAIQKR